MSTLSKLTSLTRVMPGWTVLRDRRDPPRAEGAIVTLKGGTNGEGRGYHRQQRTDRAGDLPSSGAVRPSRRWHRCRRGGRRQLATLPVRSEGPHAHEATLAAIERDHGLIRVLFNNAGIYHPGKDWLDVPPDQFDDTMSVNVRVPSFASQWVAKRLIAAGQTGAIVTTASVAGQRGSSVVEYGASKAAVINLTRSLGTRLGRHGIRVNAIAPGLINTAMGARVPRRRRTVPGQRTRTLRRAGGDRIGRDSLVSHAASFVTCATIDVNGGL